MLLDVLQWRAQCYYNVMAFDRSLVGKLALKLQLAWADFFQFVCLILLGFMEFLKEPSPLAINASKVVNKIA